MSLRQAAFGRLPVFVAGLYCVLVTVMPVGLSPTALPLARAATWVCLLCLPLCLLAPVPRVALLAGTVGVLGGALVALGVTLAAGRELGAPRLGVLGFFALPLAWGALSSPAARQGIGQGTPADWLRPRRSVPRWQVTLAGLLLLGLPLLLLWPLGVTPPAKATFALVLSLGLIVLLARTASEVFTHVWLPDAAPPHDPTRARRIAGRFVLLALALGAVVLLSRF